MNVVAEVGWIRWWDCHMCLLIWRWCTSGWAKLAGIYLNPTSSWSESELKNAFRGTFAKNFNHYLSSYLWKSNCSYRMTQKNHTKTSVAVSNSVEPKIKLNSGCSLWMKISTNEHYTSCMQKIKVLIFHKISCGICSFCLLQLLWELHL